MFGVFLQFVEGRGQTLVFVFPAERRHLRMAFGDGTRFVQHHSVHASGAFQAFGVLDEDAPFGSFADTHHDGGRCGKSQGTGAGYDEHGDQCQQAVSEAAGRVEHHPCGKGQQGNAHDDGHKDARYAVGQLLYGSFAALSVLYHVDDFGQQRVLSHLFGTEDEAAFLVDGASIDVSTRLFADGHRLATQHAFVHVRFAVDYRSVHRYPFAGFYQQQMAGKNLLQFK